MIFFFSLQLLGSLFQGMISLYGIFAERLRCRVYFIIFIMNLFIDDLHRPVMTCIQLRFQALLPEIMQEQVFYYEGSLGIAEASRRIFLFLYILFSFWTPVKTPWDNICRKLVFMMKAQGKSIAL